MLKSNDQKVPKQAEAKRDGVMNPHNYNLHRQATVMSPSCALIPQVTEATRRDDFNVCHCYQVLQFRSGVSNTKKRNNLPLLILQIE